MIGCFMRHHPLMHALRFSLPVLPVTELPGAVLISVDNHVMRHECFGAQCEKGMLARKLVSSFYRVD